MLPIITITLVVGLLATMGGVRWAKHHSRGAQFVASGMMLILGMVAPVVVKPPQQGIEEAREEKDTQGAKSGAPPHS